MRVFVTGGTGHTGYSVLDAGSVADSWRQATGTPVWGTHTGRTRTRTANRPARTPSARH
jgi:hypothetical protein